MEKNVKRVTWVVVIVVIIMSAFRIYRINSEYPIRQEKYIDFNTRERLDGDIYMTVKDVNILSYEEAKEKYEKCGIDPAGMLSNINVTVELENDSSKEVEYELYELYIETQHNKDNGMDMEMFFELNDCDMIVKIPANGKVMAILPYTITENMLNSYEAKKIDGRGLYLVMKRYPVKEFWKLYEE